MKIVLCVWNDRIAPVFDVATCWILVTVEGKEILSRNRETVCKDPAGKVELLVAAGVSEVICGAVSRPVRAMLLASGIVVHDFFAGDANTLLNARLTQGMIPALFGMPGCGRRYRGGRKNRTQRCKGGRYARW